MKFLDKFKANLLKKIKDPTDIYGAIYPLYYISSLVGLAPYQLKPISETGNNNEDNKRRFQFTLVSISKSVLLIIVIVTLVIFNTIYYRTPFQHSDIIEKLHYFQELFSSLLSCCSVTFGCIFAKTIMEVFQNIDNIDTLFRILAVWVPYKDVHVKIIFNLLLIFLTVIFCFIYFPVYYFWRTSINLFDFYKLLVLFVTVFLPYYVNILMELQYLHYLNLLRMRYKLLNEYLETLVEETSSNYNNPVFVVDQVASLHIKLTETAHLINYAFCGQQLLRITVAFVSIVTALFLIAVKFSQTSTDKNDSFELDFFFTFWAFSNALEVMLMVWITSETCEEANNCPRILHKIRNTTVNEKLQDTIEIYSLQMYHNRLYFTVCGLFPLDYTLLYTIVAGVTTYLVILIQFSNADFVKKTYNSTFSTEFPNTTTTMAV